MEFSRGKSRNYIKSKMEFFTAIESVFRFDATSNFLTKFRSFELLVAQMGFDLIIKIITISNQVGNGWYVSTMSWMGHFALGTW